MSAAPLAASGPQLRRQRSRFVGTMRLILPGVAIGLVVLVVAWPKIFGDVAGTIAPGGLFAGFSITDPMRMRHPRYVGASRAGEKPYVVIADEAVLDPKEPDKIQLLTMEATVQNQTGGETMVTADEGLYRRDLSRLDLNGSVVLTVPDGTRFTTEKAVVQLDQKSAVGDQPVHGVGPRGTLDADRFRIEDGGAVIHFMGKVRMVLVQHGPGTGATP